MAGAGDYVKFTWHQTRPNVWERDIDEIEQFYSLVARLYEGSGRMFFGMTGHLSVAADAKENLPVHEAQERFDDALKNAWLTLRGSLPTIGAQTVQNYETGDFTKVYEVWTSEGDKNDWLKRTFVPVSTGQTGMEWANNDPPAPRVPTLFVIRPPQNKYGYSVERDLVLRSPHDIIDGIGALQLFNSLVEHLAKAYAEGDSYETPKLDGSEVSRLSPPYRLAAAVPPVLGDLHVKKLEENAEQKKEVAQSSEAVTVMSLPFKNGETLPGVHKRTELSLSENNTAQITAACKKLGITVTHAFHSAAAMLVRDLQERKAEAMTVRYINYILRNERTSCIFPYNTPQHATGVYHSVSGKSLVVDMTLPAQNSNEEFADRCRREEFNKILMQVRDFYEEVRNDKDHAALAPTIFGAGAPQLPQPYDQIPPVPPPDSRPSVSLSSMGRVDSVIKPTQGSIQVYNPWVTGEELRSGLGLFLGTFRGQLCLSAAYNDAWHTEEEIASYLQRCKNIVNQGLDLD